RTATAARATLAETQSSDEQRGATRRAAPSRAMERSADPVAERAQVIQRRCLDDLGEAHSLATGAAEGVVAHHGDARDTHSAAALRDRSDQLPFDRLLVDPSFSGDDERRVG